jgi:hypothetical protein
MRLESLQSRTSNAIQLSLNLFSQADSGSSMHDSGITESDSRLMKLNTTITFVFLPATGVASVFSTPFFDVDWQSAETRKVLQTSGSFWIFWAIAMPLTSCCLLLCLAWANLPEGNKV